MTNFLLGTITQGVGFLLAVLLTTMLSGTIVHMSKKSGKVIGSTEYRSFWVLWGAFFLEAVFLSLLFTFVEPLSVMILQVFWELIPFIVIEAFFVFFLWFCSTFHFKIGKHWKFIALSQFVGILNLIFYVILR